MRGTSREAPAGGSPARSVRRRSREGRGGLRVGWWSSGCRPCLRAGITALAWALHQEQERGGRRGRPGVRWLCGCRVGQGQKQKPALYRDRLHCRRRRIRAGHVDGCTGRPRRRLRFEGVWSSCTCRRACLLRLESCGRWAGGRHCQPQGWQGRPGGVGGWPPASEGVWGRRSAPMLPAPARFHSVQRTVIGKGVCAGARTALCPAFPITGVVRQACRRRLRRRNAGLGNQIGRIRAGNAVDVDLPPAIRCGVQPASGAVWLFPLPAPSWAWASLRTCRRSWRLAGDQIVHCVWPRPFFAGASGAAPRPAAPRIATRARRGALSAVQTAVGRAPPAGLALRCCGVVRRDAMRPRLGAGDTAVWAFGLGLRRRSVAAVEAVPRPGVMLPGALGPLLRSLAVLSLGCARSGWRLVQGRIRLTF